MLPQVTVIVQAFDGYAEHWPVWHWCWKRYWDHSLPWPVIFCPEELDPPFPIRVFKTGKTSLQEYSLKTIRMAEMVQTDYLMYLVDDFWLTDKVDGKLFSKLLFLAQDRDINCLKIQCNQDEYHTLEKTNIFVGDRRLLKFAKDSRFLWNTQAGIWKTSFFRDTIVAGENPWEMEHRGTERIRQKYSDPGVYMYFWPWYTVPSAVWQGVLSEPAKQIRYTFWQELAAIQKYDLFGLQREPTVVQSTKV